MSWIKQIEVADADDKLGRIYAGLIEKRGKVANILKVHSLNPDALNNHLNLYMGIMFGPSGLSRAEREAIAVVVSASNDCDYCVHHHLEALRRYERDEEILASLAEPANLDALEPRLSIIARHAEKLTSAPGAMMENDLEELHMAGLDDRDILDLTLIVGYFNFVNRIAVGLGVTYDDEELRGYKDDG